MNILKPATVQEPSPWRTEKKTVSAHTLEMTSTNGVHEHSQRGGDEKREGNKHSAHPDHVFPPA
jgi:hypothetical protein